jgi:5'-nucleotidase
MTASPLHRWRPLVAAGLLALCAATQAAQPVPLRLIAINDFHGNLEPATLSLTLADPAGGDAKPLRVPVGGAAALAGLVQTLRAGADHSLLLSAGDLIGASPLASTLFRHESSIEVMNNIGVELNVVGNHEFDAGITELKRVAKGGCGADTGGAVVSCARGPYAGAKFPFLSANVLDARGRTVLLPYVIKRYGGVRVGVIGAVTRSIPTLVVPSGIAGLRFDDEADAVNRTARKLRAMGVRTMIAVFHEGGETGTPDKRGDWNDIACSGATGPIFDIAKRLAPEIKVVFSAHTHQGYRCMVGDKLVIQATSYGRGLAVVDVMLDPRSGRLLPDAIRSINLPVLNDRTEPAVRERLAAAAPAPYGEVLRTTRSVPAIAEQVAVYTALAAPKAQRPVGTVAATFTRAGTAESAAGRLIADSQLAATRAPDRGGAQIALMNPGGIRTDLECTGTPPCTVNFGQAFSMQPFGNSLVVMTFTGAQLKAILESQQMKPTGEPMMLQPSQGLAYTWQADAPIGERVKDLRLNGEVVAVDKPYRVTVNSFLAEGGDGFVLLKDGTAKTGGTLDLDALLDYLQQPGQREVTAQRITRLP